MLQEKRSELEEEFSKTLKPDKLLCEQIASMGFDKALIESMLKNTSNDMQKTIENLLRMQTDGTYSNALQEIMNALPFDPSMPSTSAFNEIRENINESAQEAKVRIIFILTRRRDNK